MITFIAEFSKLNIRHRNDNNNYYYNNDNDNYSDNNIYDVVKFLDGILSDNIKMINSKDIIMIIEIIDTNKHNLEPIFSTIRDIIEKYANIYVYNTLIACQQIKIKNNLSKYNCDCECQDINCIIEKSFAINIGFSKCFNKKINWYFLNLVKAQYDLELSWYNLFQTIIDGEELNLIKINTLCVIHNIYKQKRVKMCKINLNDTGDENNTSDENDTNGNDIINEEDIYAALSMDIDNATGYYRVHILDIINMQKSLMLNFYRKICFVFNSQ